MDVRASIKIQDDSDDPFNYGVMHLEYDGGDGKVAITMSDSNRTVKVYRTDLVKILKLFEAVGDIE